MTLLGFLKNGGQYLRPRLAHLSSVSYILIGVIGTCPFRTRLRPRPGCRILIQVPTWNPDVSEWWQGAVLQLSRQIPPCVTAQEQRLIRF
jgi:hypothetical protein